MLVNSAELHSVNAVEPLHNGHLGERGGLHWRFDCKNEIYYGILRVSRAHFIGLQTVCLTVKDVETFLHKLVQRSVKKRLKAADILSCAQRSVSKGSLLVCDNSLWECHPKLLLTVLLLSHWLTPHRFSN